MIPRRSRSATSSLRAISVVAAPSIADPSPPRRPIRRNRICGFTGKVTHIASGESIAPPPTWRDTSLLESETRFLAADLGLWR